MSLMRCVASWGVGGGRIDSAKVRTEIDVFVLRQS